MEKSFILRKLTSIYRFVHYQVPQNNLRYAHKAATKTNEADYQLEENHIEEAIKVNPVLAGVGAASWKRAHETFANHGLTTVSFLRIVTGNPVVLRSTPERIIDSLEQWRGCQFGERNLHLLITKYPEMLNVDNSTTLHKHIVFLKSQVLTQKNIWQVLMNSPDLMEQSEDTIKEKMQYLTEVMRIEVPEIVKSCTLSKSLREIRTRHVFQERLGIFKPRNPKAPELTPSTNDRLYKIMDTSDKAFATKVCHVSLEEYEVFNELFKREDKRKASKTTKEYYHNLYEHNDGGQEEEEDEDSDDDIEYVEKKNNYNKAKKR